MKFVPLLESTCPQEMLFVVSPHLAQVIVTVKLNPLVWIRAKKKKKTNNFCSGNKQKKEKHCYIAECYFKVFQNSPSHSWINWKILP